MKKRYLIPKDYTADPAVHFWRGKTWLFPSHDRDTGIPEQDDGSHFDMVDYHVYSIDGDPMTGNVTDHGIVLALEDIPWAEKQLWDSDATEKNGRYYICFSAKDKTGTFRLGIASASTPEGPYTAEENYIKDSYSIDPCIFAEDEERYAVFGGLWGGQLQRYRDNKSVYSAEEDAIPDGSRSPIEPAPQEKALCAKIARFTDDMLGFAEEPKDIVILDPVTKSPILAGDHGRRFFEGSWLFKKDGTYYFTYSTGDTHLLAYATSESLYGPYIYRGTIMTPVVGWTTHHAVAEIRGKWYLFHHDSVPSGGKTWLRSVKVAPLEFLPDGSIATIDGLAE